MKAVTSTDVLELVAFGAGLWIFLTFSIGAIVSKATKQEETAEDREPV